MKVAEFVPEQPIQFQQLDAVPTLFSLYHAVNDVRVEPAGAGIVRLDPARRNRIQRLDAVHDKTYRGPGADDDHARGIVEGRIRQRQKPSQADDREDRPAKVGETQKAARAERHIGDAR